MTSALAGIALAFFLSLSSLMVILLRVSPLRTPGYALPFFFLSIFIAVASFMALLLCFAKLLVLFRPGAMPQARPVAAQRAVVGSSLRQGIFIASAVILIVFLWLLRILNWWIAVLISIVFILIEMAASREK